jgi:hypothetical protein
VDQQAIGAYAMLGFGKWGILTEHELIRRTPASNALSNFHKTRDGSMGKPPQA